MMQTHLPSDMGGSEWNGTKSLVRWWFKIASTKGSGRSRFHLSAIPQVLYTKLSSIDVTTSVCYYETCWHHFKYYYSSIRSYFLAKYDRNLKGLGVGETPRCQDISWNKTLWSVVHRGSWLCCVGFVRFLSGYPKRDFLNDFLLGTKSSKIPVFLGGTRLRRLSWLRYL